MSGKRYVDGSCEIVCFGRRATVHDRRFDRYYSVGAEELAEQSIPWRSVAPAVPNWALGLFFVSLGVFVCMDATWFFRQPRVRPDLGSSIAMLAFIIANLAVHEAAHIGAMRVCGRKPSRVGLKLNYYVLPAVYVRMNQVLLLSPAERVFCHTAGIWVNAATALWFVFYCPTGPGGDVRRYIGCSFILMIMLNLMPILNSDGQKALMVIIDHPEARRRVDFDRVAVAVKVISICFLVILFARLLFPRR